MESVMSLHVFTDDQNVDSVVAESVQDAWAVWTEHTGITAIDVPEMEWNQVPDDKPITLNFEDEERDGDNGKITRTASEWAQRKGRGFLGSTEF